MSIPDKETIALDQDELEILDAIRRVAPRHHIPPKLAQTYGVWTVCFRRYCQEQNIPWLWMSSVSDFMDFLDLHPNVSPPERNRALDGIMFYITDVHKSEKEDSSEETHSSVPQSTQSLFAKMLLRCDVQLTEALRLRREDVHLDEATVTLPETEDGGPRTVSVPSTLHEGLKHHVERVEDRTTSTNPLLFGPHERAPQSDEPSDPNTDPSTDEELDRSTELATRVMRTFGDDPGDETDAS